jgi:hypothetical protein
MLEVLKLFAPDPDALQPDGQECAPARPDLPAAREQLRAAFVARTDAEAALKEAEATTERVRQLIADADAAERAAGEAAKAAAAATRRWAVAGARGDMRPEEAALLEEAEAAGRRARAARLKADGATAALPEVETAEREARIALESAGDQVQSAVRAVMVVTAEEHLAIIARAYDAVAEDVLAVRALAHSLTYGKVTGTPHGGAAELLARLRASLPSDPAEVDFADWRDGWVRYAKALASDPGAEFPS